MTAITFSTATRLNASAFKFREVLAALKDTIDAFAMYRMQRSVPESELCRVDREIGRYRKLMNPNHAALPDSMRHGR